MSETLVARRYAEGLSSIVRADGELQPVLDELRAFVETYRESSELRGVLENKGLEMSVRANVLEAVIKRMRMPEVPASFLRALFKRHRMPLVEAAVDEFAHLCDIRLNRESAEITTAVPLSREQTEQVVHAVATFAGKSIKATQEVDPEIIGGIVVHVGGFVLDRSVRGELNRIKRELLEQE